MKQFFEKHREIILYLVFGLLTTVVSFAAYFVVLWSGQSIAGIPENDHTSVRYWIVYVLAQVVQWLVGVLFAFFTNRLWVFTDARKNGSLISQLIKFSAARVVTFFVDLGVTYGLGILLVVLTPALTTVPLFGKTWNFCEIIAKIVAALIVVISNYIISKVFVFNKSKKKQREENAAS